VGQAGVFRVQLGPLLFARIQPAQLAHLPLQAFTLLVERVALAAGLRQCLKSLAPVAPGRHQGHELQAGLLIQQ